MVSYVTVSGPEVLALLVVRRFTSPSRMPRRSAGSEAAQRAEEVVGLRQRAVRLADGVEQERHGVDPGTRRCPGPAESDHLAISSRTRGLVTLEIGLVAIESGAGSTACSFGRTARRSSPGPEIPARVSAWPAARATQTYQSRCGGLRAGAGETTTDAVGGVVQRPGRRSPDPAVPAVRIASTRSPWRAQTWVHTIEVTMSYRRHDPVTGRTASTNRTGDAQFAKVVDPLGQARQIGRRPSPFQSRNVSTSSSR